MGGGRQGQGSGQAKSEITGRNHFGVISVISLPPELVLKLFSLRASRRGHLGLATWARRLGDLATWRLGFLVARLFACLVARLFGTRLWH